MFRSDSVMPNGCQCRARRSGTRCVGNRSPILGLPTSRCGGYLCSAPQLFNDRRRLPRLAISRNFVGATELSPSAQSLQLSHVVGAENSPADPDIIGRAVLCVGHGVVSSIKVGMRLGDRRVFWVRIPLLRQQLDLGFRGSHRSEHDAGFPNGLSDRGINRQRRVLNVSQHQPFSPSFSIWA